MQNDAINITFADKKKLSGKKKMKNLSTISSVWYKSALVIAYLPTIHKPKISKSKFVYYIAILCF